MREEYIKFPQTGEEISIVQQGFYQLARFPRVVGALDCTHIKIKSPGMLIRYFVLTDISIENFAGGENAEIYRNRKNFFSLNVQTIAASNLKIINIVARWPGSAHDSTIFRNSEICRKFQNAEMERAILVGDAGYPIQNFLMTPLTVTNTIAQNLYNESLIRTRNPVERSYGVWKRRFPILSNGINLHLRMVPWIIVATAVLHNIAILNDEDEPPPLNLEEQRAFDLADDVPVADDVNRNNNNRARNEFIAYFANL